MIIKLCGSEVYPIFYVFNLKASSNPLKQNCALHKYTRVFYILETGGWKVDYLKFCLYKYVVHLHSACRHWYEFSTSHFSCIFCHSFLCFGIVRLRTTILCSVILESLLQYNTHMKTKILSVLRTSVFKIFYMSMSFFI